MTKESQETFQVFLIIQEHHTNVASPHNFPIAISGDILTNVVLSNEGSVTITKPIAIITSYDFSISVSDVIVHININASFLFCQMVGLSGFEPLVSTLMRRVF
jgi:hypothetical protein